MENKVTESNSSSEKKDAKNGVAEEVTTTENNGSLVRAVESWEMVYREDPLNDLARSELKKVYFKAKRWNALNELLKFELNSAAQDAVEERIDLLKELLELNRNQIGADEVVINAYHKAILELDPEDPESRAAMEELCVKEGRWGDFAKILSARIDKADDLSLRLKLLHQQAELWTHKLRVASGAVSTYEEILRLNPEDRAAKSALKALHRKRKSWRSLLRILENEKEAAEGDPKLTVLIQMTEIVADKIGDHARATSMWWKVLELDPGNDKALSAIEKYATGRKDWETYSRIMEIRVTHSKNDEERIAYLFKLGTVYEDRLEDPERTAEVWSRVLMLKPDDRRAYLSLKATYTSSENWRALEDLFLDVGDYKGLAETLSIIAKKQEDPAIQKKLLLRCIELYEGPIGKPDRTLQYYKRLKEVDPSDDRAARKLLPVFRKQKQWKDLFSVVTTIYDVSGEFPLPEDDVEALTNTSMIARKTESWHSLVEIEKRLRGQKDLEEFRWYNLSVEIAIILDERLAKRGEAIKIFCEIFQIFPGDLKSISIMQQYLYDTEHCHETAKILLPHLEASEKFKMQTRALSILIESTMNIDECLEMQLILAEIYDKKLDDPFSAFETLAGALKEHQSNRDVWSRLTTISEERDLDDQFIALLSEAYQSWQLDEETEEEIAKKLAQLLENQSGRTKEVEQFHRRVLKTEPTNNNSFSYVTNLCIREERWGELVEIYERALEYTSDDLDKLDILDKLSNVFDDVLDDTPRAINVFQNIMRIDPANQKAVSRLNHLYEAESRWEDLHGLISLQLKSSQKDVAGALYRRLADLEEKYLDRPRAALERYKKILINYPEDDFSIQGLERLVEKRETRNDAAGLLKHVYWNRKMMEPLAKMLVVELENPELADSEKIHLYGQLGNLHEKYLGDLPGAFKTYAAALRALPESQQVRAKLFHIAGEIGCMEKYALLLEKTADSVEEGKPVASEMLLEAARVYREEIRDPEKVEAIVGRLLEKKASEPSQVISGLEMLEKILEDRRAWTELVDVLRQKTSYMTDENEKVEQLHRIAAVEQFKTGRIEAAISVYKSILDIEKKDMKAVLELESLLEKQGMWLELIEILRLRSSLETSSQVRREITLRISQIAARLGT